MKVPDMEATDVNRDLALDLDIIEVKGRSSQLRATPYIMSPL
jgi:hypothetical protein